MNKILLRSPQGDRWVEEGQPFRFLPGEAIVEDGNGRAVISPDEDEKELNAGIAAQGIQLGDAIAKLTKILRIPHCSKCEQRRKILNTAKELGIKETLKKLKETL